MVGHALTPTPTPTPPFLIMEMATFLSLLYLEGLPLPKTTPNQRMRNIWHLPIIELRNFLGWVCLKVSSTPPPTPSKFWFNMYNFSFYPCFDCVSMFPGIIHLHYIYYNVASKQWLHLEKCCHHSFKCENFHFFNHFSPPTKLMLNDNTPHTSNIFFFFFFPNSFLYLY